MTFSIRLYNIIIKYDIEITSAVRVQSLYTQPECFPTISRLLANYVQILLTGQFGMELGRHIYTKVQ